MAASNISRVRTTSPSEHTADRIRAYVASLQPRDGSSKDQAYHRGRAIIEQLALSCPTGPEDTYEDPQLTLTPAQIADVVNFIHGAEPIDSRAWWDDPKHTPNHICGFMFVLHAIEDSLRQMPVRRP